MAAGDLATIDQLQQAVPNLTAAQLAYAPTLITAASGFIAARYPKAQAPTARDEEHTLGTDRTLNLGARPVIAIDRVAADNAQVVLIRHTDPASARATVRVTADATGQTSTGIELKAWSGGILTHTTSLLWTDDPGIQGLADHVNTLAGWTATVPTGMGLLATADIRPVQGALGAIGSPAALRAYTRDLDDFTVQREQGTITLYEWRQESYRFPDRTWGNDPRDGLVRVIYTAGRPTPAEVTAATIMLVQTFFDSTRFAGVVTSEETEDYKYQLAAGSYALPGPAQLLLSRFKDRRFS